jgi:Protein of unknown function (DUF3352)
MTIRRVPGFRRLLPLLATLALTGLVVAGCGGSGKASAVGATGTEGRAAQAFPASTAAFFDANIDESSTAWKQLLAIGQRFPSWPKLVTQFNSAANDATDDGPTLAQLRAWLGTELAIGVLNVPTDGADPNVLGFADVRDRAQLEAALAKEEKTRVLGKHGDFDLFGNGEDTVVAISADTALVSNHRAVVDAAIERLAGTGDRLSDHSDFKDTLAALASDNILVGYAPGSVLRQLVALTRKQDTTVLTKDVPAAQFDQLFAKLGDVRSLGLSIGTTENGLRLRQVTVSDGDVPATFEPSLLARVPANSWFAASFADIGKNAKGTVAQALGTNADARKQVAQVEAALGITLDDVYALLSGEHALYAGPGAPLSAGLILHPADVAKGAETLKSLTKLLTQQGITFTDTSDGQSAVIQGFAARWRAVDDVIGIGSDAAVGNAVKDSIVDSDKFKRVLAENGIASDAKTLGLAYIDVPSLVNLASAFGAFNDAGQKEALDNLRHIGGVLFWAGADGGTVTTDLFVEST